MDIVLTDSVLSVSGDVGGVTLYYGVITGEQVFNSLLREVIALVKKNEVVSENAHLLHGNCL